MDVAFADRPSTLDDAIGRAVQALLRLQREDGHWLFELEADCTIPAEYVLLKHYLGEPDDLALERKLAAYLRRIQGDHGGWALYHDGAFDISATVKSYFALKMVGDDIEAPHMHRAREAVLAQGGAGASNVFTRIQLALYGAGSWDSVPTLPPELILLPRWFPIHLSKMSYWARTVIVPLLVLQAKKPLGRNPRGVRIDELYDPQSKTRARSKAEHVDPFWTWFFNALDVVLKAADGWWPATPRRKAIERCLAFVVERLNGEDGLGAIYPAMANAVMMFDALGYPENHPDRAIARRAVEKLLVLKDDEAYCQPCLSPVWDTALSCCALMETGAPEAEAAALEALHWLRPRQVLDISGDWAETRPHVRPGGWAFQYANAHYPDLDDTAVVVMAMDRARQRLGARGFDRAILRGEEWVRGMQSRNGGWAAFDVDNCYEYLNNIPFADHGALLDPPTADVSARCIGMLAQLGAGADDPALRKALAWLEAEQQKDGSWVGRWGVNYIYGAWSTLCALNAAGVDLKSPTVRRAVDWLLRIQNADGGWGESCDSYDLAHTGHEPTESRASQTAWALLGLMAAGEGAHPAVARGVDYLRQRQSADGFWSEPHYTGGGFPRVFYLRYHGYSKFFPLWALARYQNLMRANEPRVGFGVETP